MSPTAKKLANINGLLTISGSGNDILEFFNTNGSPSETYTFDAGPNNLTLGTVPFHATFTGIQTGGIYLQTNGGTVNDPSGKVKVNGTPP